MSNYEELTQLGRRHYGRHESNYCSHGPYYHHKPQFVRVGDLEKAEIEVVRAPRTDKSEFNYDQEFYRYDFDYAPLDDYDSDALWRTCMDMTRTLKLPGLVQNIVNPTEKIDTSGFKSPSDDEMRRLILKHNDKLVRARLQSRPIERGVCVGYWQNSNPPFRHAVHATQTREGRIMLRVADTNEEWFYQTPVPLNIPLPVLWNDVVVAKRFDFVNPHTRNDAVKEAIHRELWQWWERGKKFGSDFMRDARNCRLISGRNGFASFLKVEMKLKVKQPGRSYQFNLCEVKWWITELWRVSRIRFFSVIGHVTSRDEAEIWFPIFAASKHQELLSKPNICDSYAQTQWLHRREQRRLFTRTTLRE